MRYSVSIRFNDKVSFIIIEGKDSYESLSKLKAELKDKFPRGIVESMILTK